MILSKHLFYIKNRERARRGRRCLAPQEKGARLRRLRSGFCGLKTVNDLAQPNVALKDLCPAKISSSWKSAKVMMRLKSTLVLFVLFLALTQARQRGSRGGSSQPSKEETEKSDREGKCNLDFTNSDLFKILSKKYL